MQKQKNIAIIPIHLNSCNKNLNWEKGNFPVAENYYNRCLSLPMFPTLSDEEQDFVINKVKEFISK